MLSSSQVFSIEEKGLQSDQNKKIRLGKKISSNKKYPNLIDSKYNKEKSNAGIKYRIESLTNTDWTKIIWTNLDWQDRLDCDV